MTLSKNEELKNDDLPKVLSARALRLQELCEALTGRRRTNTAEVHVITFLGRLEHMVLYAAALTRNVLVLTHLRTTLEHAVMSSLVLGEKLRHRAREQLVQNVEFHLFLK